MRRGVETLLDVAERLWREGEAKLILFFAPGGYGKSVAPPHLLKIAKEIGLADHLIHVLPARSLVSNLYLCKYLYPFTSGAEKAKLEEICMGRVAYEELANVVKGVARGREYVAYQAGIDIRYEVGPGKRLQVIKSPLFEDIDIVVSTLDSLLFNAFKVPVTEIYRKRKHYAIPFSWIYTSLVYLDEMHASFEDEVFSSTIVLLDLLNAAKIPVVAATATPIPNTVELVSSHTWGRVRPTIVKMCRRGEEGGNDTICFYDEDFEGKVLNVEWQTHLVELSKILSIIYENVRSGRRVLVALDSVGNAIDIFDKLKRCPDIASQAVLLHGKMSRMHQRRVLEQLKDKKVLVVTPIINAGVDITFDVAVLGVSDPLVLVQFLARVCRDNDCGEVEVYIVKDLVEKRMYEKLQQIMDNNTKSNKLNWHLPYSLNDIIGYDVVLKLASVPKINGEKVVKLRDLAFSALLTSKEITDLFTKELGGEIARSILTEIVTITEGEINRIKNSVDDINDVVNSLEDLSITYSFSELVEALNKSEPICIDKFLIIDSDGDLRLFSVGRRGINIDGKLITNGYEYIATLINLRAKYAGFVMSKKDGCYDDERGLLRLP